MKKLLSILLICGLLVFSLNCSKEKKVTPPSETKNLYWGDLHNHNAVGYAKGSLERTYDIAKSHLDFFCFTPHTHWHDMPEMPQQAHMKWVHGFKVTADNWDKVKQMANENYKPGTFVPFIGYEWHSSSDGDVHMIYPGDVGKLNYTADIKKLQALAKESNALLVPHHPAYKLLWRGQNWASLDVSVSPVLEIFSEHGNAESDRSPYRYIRHSMGGRHTVNTLQWLLKQGVKVGVVASTDDHLGYPGAYGEGLAAVYADELTRESVLDAIKARRTYGINMDRIALDFRLNGHWMGESIANATSRNIYVKAIGKGVVDRVEILKNNEVIHREFPIDQPVGKNSWDKPVLCRVEFGWGPWGDLNMARVCDWDFNVDVKNGKVLSVTPCFQAGPYVEDKRNLVSNVTENGCNVVSYTSRKQAYEERATNAIILEIQGSPETTVDLSLDLPTEMTVSKTLGELAESSDIFFTGRFTAESILMHRVVFHENYFTEFEFEDKGTGESTDWYYARVVQTNGSLAWSSPIWVEK